MRALWAGWLLVGTVASASGTTIVNTEPDPPLKIGPSPRLRLAEIQTELYSLEHRASGGEVFARKMSRTTPYLALSSLPLLAVGAFLGLTRPTGSSAELGAAVGVSVGLVAAVWVCGLIVSALATLDHWVHEAASAPARAARVRALQAERQKLLTLRL